MDTFIEVRERVNQTKKPETMYVDFLNTNDYRQGWTAAAGYWRRIGYHFFTNYAHWNWHLDLRTSR